MHKLSIDLWRDGLRIRLGLGLKGCVEAGCRSGLSGCVEKEDQMRFNRLCGRGLWREKIRVGEGVQGQHGVLRQFTDDKNSNKK